jgi:hypothetical protein
MIIKHLSDTLFLAEHDIVSFSLTSPHRYKVYEIPKRNSKKLGRSRTLQKSLNSFKGHC